VTRPLPAGRDPRSARPTMENTLRAVSSMNFSSCWVGSNDKGRNSANNIDRRPADERTQNAHHGCPSSVTKKGFRLTQDAIAAPLPGSNKRIGQPRCLSLAGMCIGSRPRDPRACFSPSLRTPGSFFRYGFRTLIHQRRSTVTRRVPWQMRKGSIPLLPYRGERNAREAYFSDATSFGDLSSAVQNLLSIAARRDYRRESVLESRAHRLLSLGKVKDWLIVP